MPKCVGHVPKICNFRLVVCNQGTFPPRTVLCNLWASHKKIFLTPSECEIPLIGALNPGTFRTFMPKYRVLCPSEVSFPGGFKGSKEWGVRMRWSYVETAWYLLLGSEPQGKGDQQGHLNGATHSQRTS